MQATLAPRGGGSLALARSRPTVNTVAPPQKLPGVDICGGRLQYQKLLLECLQLQECALRHTDHPLAAGKSTGDETLERVLIIF